MKLIKFILKKGILISLLLSVIIHMILISIADSAPNVNWAKAEPIDISVNLSTNVKITAQIDDDDKTLIISSISLRRIDQSGKLIENMGTLYDDGTHGDSVANDNIFSSEIRINETEPKKLFLEVSVAYKGLIKRINYNFSINIVAQESAEATRSQFIYAIREGDLSSAMSKLLSSKANELTNLDRASQLRFADWIENAVPIELKENCMIYKGLWEDSMAVKYELNFMILRTELGEWKIVG